MIRLHYLDNLKAFLIILVVLIHTAVTYSGLGMWYYKEPRPMGDVSFYIFLFFQTFTQAFFMSLFFMISAYFIPESAEKKGPKKFVFDRLFRLGIPLVIFIFLIQPLCLALTDHDIGIYDRYVKGITSFAFLGWTGPLWFVEALLIFSFIYLIIKKPIDSFISRYAFDVTARNALILVLLITLCTFLVRIPFPIGTSVMNMQLCFFPAYIFMFLGGMIARKKDLFSRVDYQAGKKWLLAAFAFGVPLWLVIVRAGVSSSRNLSFRGGWNALSLFFAFWESFICVTVIVALVGIFRERFNTQNRLQKALSDNAFGVYVFHAPVLISISILFKRVNAPALLKFALIGCLAVPVCFIVSGLIRKIPVLKNIFS